MTAPLAPRLEQSHAGCITPPLYRLGAIPTRTTPRRRASSGPSSTWRQPRCPRPIHDGGERASWPCPS